MTEGILYLSSADVVAAMPPVSERIRLAERSLAATVRDAELPAKFGVHPRPERSLAHAMPALLRPASAKASDTSGDILGMKWGLGFPTNRAVGLPLVSGVVILSDPATGLVTAIMDAAVLSALRTAAVSGVAVSHFAPAEDRDPVAAIIGAGAQGYSHAEVLGSALPGVRLLIHDRHPDRARALAEHASTAFDGVASAQAVLAARSATSAASVVVTAITFPPARDRQVLTPDWLRSDATVVAVDYASMVSATTARAATLFLTDHMGQFFANRDAGQFDGYPDPTTTIGEALLAGTRRPATGLVVVTHLGIGLTDIMFADAVAKRAMAAGIGVVLPR